MFNVRPTLNVLVVLAAFIHCAGAFTASNRRQSGYRNIDQHMTKLSDVSHHALFYRAHDVDDDEESLAKLKYRAAPTFKRSDLQTIPAERGGINKNLVYSLILNQCIILILSTGLTALYVFLSGKDAFLREGVLNWTSMDDFQSHLSLTTLSLVQGIFGAVPSIALSNVIERSDDRRFATTNFSTNYMVMTLFGRRVASKGNENVRKPSRKAKTIDIALVSAGISILTGICEEITFRGLIPHLLHSTVTARNTAFTCIFQAAIFGGGHLSPRTSLEENATIGSLQFANGIWSGLLYLWTGNVVPCIIFHALYDFQILFFTWVNVNDQLDYVSEKCRERVPNSMEDQVREIERSIGLVDPSNSLFQTCRTVFYIFDSDKNGTISKSEAQRGISYLQAQGTLLAPSQKNVDSIFDKCIQLRSSNIPNEKSIRANQLELPDFMRLFWTVKRMGEFQNLV